MALDPSTARQVAAAATLLTGLPQQEFVEVLEEICQRRQVNRDHASRPRSQEQKIDFRRRFDETVTGRVHTDHGVG